MYSSQALMCAALAVLASPAAMAAPLPVTSMHGGPVRLSQEERAHVLDGNYELLAHVADLPASVKSAFAGDDFKMADPGEEYQATDVVIPGKRLPWRRLVLAGCTEVRCFIHYEKGGYAHSYFVVVFDLEAGAASFRWGAFAFKVAPDLATLRSKIQSGLFDDSHPNYW